jgi:hypothetical protein
VNDAKVTYRQRALEILGDPTAEGDIEWVSAAILVIVGLVLAETVVRSVNSVVLSAAFQADPRLTEERRSKALEQAFGLEKVEKNESEISPQQCREREMLLWDRQRMELRDEVYRFMLLTWVLFEFSLNAYNRTPDLPLQP